MAAQHEETPSSDTGRTTAIPVASLLLLKPMRSEQVLSSDAGRRTAISIAELLNPIQSMIDVFETYELIEMILTQPPMKDVLLAQRVNKTFKHVIERSIKLQQKLFFKPMSSEAARAECGDGKCMVNPLIVQKWNRRPLPLFSIHLTLCDDDLIKDMQQHMEEPQLRPKSLYTLDQACTQHNNELDKDGKRILRSSERMLVVQGAHVGRHMLLLADVGSDKPLTFGRMRLDCRVGEIQTWMRSLRKAGVFS